MAILSAVCEKIDFIPAPRVKFYRKGEMQGS